MTKHEKIRDIKLAEMEEEFASLLLSCLQQCAQGRWGLFGQNEHFDIEGRYLRWPEAKRLNNLAQGIKTIRGEFGQSNEMCERLLHFCSLRGSNVSGEPKLAALLLAEIEKVNR